MSDSREIEGNFTVDEPECRLRSSPRSPRRVEGTPHFFVQESTDAEVVRSTIERDESPGN